jgi:UDP-3-O-acyl N-acetylglucosamine deacetylase
MPVSVCGRGFLTGQPICIRFLPAPANFGIVFVRTDGNRQACVPAVVDQVTGTDRRTTLGMEPASVALVEHVLAALAGLRIDNCRIELDGPEPPGLDGSAAPFVARLQRAGIEIEGASRPIYTIQSPMILRQGGATLSLFPVEDGELRISYLLDYGAESPITRQRHTESITPSAFCRELAYCRTFVLQREVEALHRQGIGLHISPAEVLVFGPRGPVQNRLRCANEPARHKILDIVGDLALLGVDLRGHVVGYRSGHLLNVALVRQLAASGIESTNALYSQAA